jgi:pseudouridine 5'-phosphatase
MKGKERKPAPDTYLLSKQILNDVLRKNGEPELDSLECLVFEDSIAGVEAGRNAGMRVVWVPHPGLAKVCRGREQEVLMGITEREGTPVFEDEGNPSASQSFGAIVSEDGRAEKLDSLENFPYAKYGIKVES